MEDSVIFRLAGEGGEGVISCSDILTQSASQAGLEIFTFRTYPAEIKGGPCMYQLRVGREILFSKGDAVDVLVCFNQEAYDLHADSIRKQGGVLVYDSSSCKPKEGVPEIQYAIPVSDMARKELNSYLTKNIIFLGILAKLFNFPLEKLVSMISKRFVKKGEAIVNLNVRALEHGYKYVEQHVEKKDPYAVGRKDTNNRMVISGNQALALGALVAGCRFYAGYPITPATDIMEWLSKEMPRFGGALIQAEDEIAALSMVLGAGYGGVKAMTATSGPGFSLMTELLGLASMAEIPCVIVDVQRAGPSTGMPTKTEQSDLYQALYGGHGEAPRIVMALTSVQDSFYGIIRAFNYAVRCQCPVIVLSDQSLAQRTSTIPRPDLTSVLIEERRKPSEEELQAYKRYKLTTTGVSPMAIPGERGSIYTATGLEHGEEGSPNWDQKNHLTMQEKRYQKLDLVLKGAELIRHYGSDKPDVGIISWGSTEGVVREAVTTATSMGFKVGALHPRVLNPLPVHEMEAFIRSCKKIIVPELNYLGQFARLIRERFQVDVIPFNKISGLPFSPIEIVSEIERVTRQYIKTSK